MKPVHCHWTLLGFAPRHAVAALIATVALAGLLGASPVSPGALGLADADLLDGDALGAVRAYEAAATWNPSATVRQEALFRSAQVWKVELGRPELARERLERLLSEVPDGPRTADAWEALGFLHRELQPDGIEAGEAFFRAFRAERDHDRAAERLTLSARAFAEAGEGERAAAQWHRLERQFPDRKARARIGLAGLALGAGDAQAALLLYEEAIPHANDPVVRRIASLGAASCLERLGNLDEALAELDSASLPDDVHARRRRSLEHRRAEQGSSGN